jgi:hypothetical protein
LPGRFARVRGQRLDPLKTLFGISVRNVVSGRVVESPVPACSRARRKMRFMVPALIERSFSLISQLFGQP